MRALSVNKSFAMVAIALGMIVNAGSSQAAELVMFEQAGCGWCLRWDREVAPVYGKTPEGKQAPLRRLDIHQDLPADLAFLSKGSYTPTFVLVDEGREIGRIRGYPGEDFFWGLLGQLLAKLKPEDANLTNRRAQ